MPMGILVDMFDWGFKNGGILYIIFDGDTKYNYFDFQIQLYVELLDLEYFRYLKTSVIELCFEI